MVVFILHSFTAAARHILLVSSHVQHVCKLCTTFGQFMCALFTSATLDQVL
jgi:hypothetical protein